MATAVEIPIPAGMSDQEVRSMREEIAVHLFRLGYLSAREAANWLSITYESFYELAARQRAVEITYDSQAVSREVARLTGKPS